MQLQLLSLAGGEPRAPIDQSVKILVSSSYATVAPAVTGVPPQASTLSDVLYPSGLTAVTGVSLDIENYCTLRSFFDLPTLAGLSRRNLPETGIRLLFQI